MTTKKTKASATAEAKKNIVKNSEKTTYAANAIKPLKVFAELIKGAWAYFMTGIAIVTFIWTLGVKSERKSIDTEAVKTEINKLKQDTKKIDTLLYIINNIQETQYTIIENQNAMRDSYTKYLINDDNLSKQDFMDYMEGLEFRLKPAEIPPTIIKKDTLNYKPNIKVRSIDTTNYTLNIKVKDLNSKKDTK